MSQPTRCHLLILPLLLSALLACSETAEQDDDPPTDAGAQDASSEVDASPDASSDSEADAAEPPDASPEVDSTPCAESNACGGCEALAASPDDPCGPCMDGRLVCEGSDALECQGSSLDCQREEFHCDDLIDNDGNGLIDCLDPACATFDACRDWSCVDRDLGSSLGWAQDLTDLTAHQGNLNEACLEGRPYRVFRWTAPHKGLFNFEARHGEIEDFGIAPLGVLRGDCAAPPATLLCGRPARLNEWERGESPPPPLDWWLHSLPLSLEAGETLLFLTAEDAVPGIAEREISSGWADSSVWTSGEARGPMQIVPAMSPDQLPWIFHGPIPSQRVELRKVEVNEGLIKSNTLATLRYNTDGAAPFYAKADLTGDGIPDFIGSSLYESWSYLIVPGPYPSEGPVTDILEFTEINLWRPLIDVGDVTGDGAPDALIWSGGAVPNNATTPTHWSIIDDVTTLLDPDAEPIPLPVQVYHRYSQRTGSICDINGDGIQDLVLLEPTGSESFEARFILGPITRDNPPQVHASIEGLQKTSEDASPMAVADLNGDHICDVLLRAPFAETSARPYIFLGPFNGNISLDDPSLYIDNALGWYGSFKIADINNDGINDILASGWNRDPRLPYRRGTVCIHLGPFLEGEDRDSFSAPVCLVHDVVSSRPTHEDGFGYNIEVYDLDADGLQDIIVENDVHLLHIFSGKTLLRVWESLEP